MASNSSSSPTLPSLQVAKRDRALGFAILLVSVGLPLTVLAFLPLFDYVFHQIRWNLVGTSNYTITVDNQVYGAVFTDAGIHTIQVRNGRVSRVLESCCGQETAERFTIEQLFQNALGCAVSPFILDCTIHYNDKFGYPETVSICNKMVSVESCGIAVKVLEVRFDP